MNENEAKEFKQLLSDEINIRERFRKARAKLEEMVSVASKHNRECCDFWGKHLPEAKEVVLTMDNGLAFKITRPEREKASCESYLPYGIDYEQLPAIQIDTMDVKQ
jgi:hypothetical protein